MCTRTVTGVISAALSEAYTAFRMWTTVVSGEVQDIVGNSIAKAR
jgi:hypothetical protein